MESSLSNAFILTKSRRKQIVDPYGSTVRPVPSEGIFWNSIHEALSNWFAFPPRFGTKSRGCVAF